MSLIETAFRGKPLVELKALSELDEPSVGVNKATSPKSWYGSARTLIAQSELAKDEGELEAAYVYTRKAANIALFMTSIHPEATKSETRKLFRPLLLETSGPEYKARLGDLERTLIGRKTIGSEHRTSSTPLLPTSTNHDSSSPQAAPQPKSIKERMAALQGAGLNTGSPVGRLGREPAKSSQQKPEQPIKLESVKCDLSGPSSSQVGTKLEPPANGISLALEDRTLPEPSLPPPPSSATSGSDTPSPPAQAPPRPAPPSRTGFVRHSHSASLPPPRHHSPPPIPSKGASLANYRGRAAGLAAASSPKPTPLPELMDDESFESQFPSIAEFETNGLPLSPPPQSSSSPATSSLGFPSLPSVPLQAPDSPALASLAESTASLLVSPSATRPPSPIVVSSSSGSFPGSSPPAPVSKPLARPEAQIDFPFANTIFPNLLRSYFDANAKLLLLDVRPASAYAAGHITGSSKVAAAPSNVISININPKWTEEYDLTSRKVEQRLEGPDRLAFASRNTFDLVVIYDSTSSPGSPTAGAIDKIASVIFDREFSSTVLRRAPVVLLGGYAAWIAELSRSARTALTASPMAPIPARLSQPDAQRNGSVESLNGAMHFSPSAPSLVSLPQSSTYYQDSAYGRSFSSFAPTSPSSRYQLSSSVVSPPPASISASLSRRRSDYADQAGQAYSGYQSHASRASISYPSLQSPGIPQPPPPAVTPALERQNSRSSLVRSNSVSQSGAVGADELRYWGDEIVGLSGLKNLGNTCYQNSTLQCLSATVPFSTFFRDGRWKRAVNLTNPLGTKGNLASAYSSLISALWQQEYHFIQPLSFRKSIVKFAPAFDGSDQQDSQEFLAFLLDGLHEDLNRVQIRPEPLPMTPEREAELNTLPPHIAGEKEWKQYLTRNDSIVVDWFQGQFRSRVQCQTCLQSSSTWDAFMYLSLPVPNERSRKRVTLDDCLDSFVKEEIMEKGNAWNCPRCKLPRTATKSISLSRLPPVLLIHLKRFSTQNGVFWDKAETLVDFPVRELDLSRFVPPPVSTATPDTASSIRGDASMASTYELYAVSNHSGRLSDGHYTAFVKSSQRHWKYCDDRTVTEADESTIVSKHAYILFYRRTRRPRPANL